MAASSAIANIFSIEPQWRNKPVESYFSSLRFMLMLESVSTHTHKHTYAKFIHMDALIEIRKMWTVNKIIRKINIRTEFVCEHILFKQKNMQTYAMSHLCVILKIHFNVRLFNDYKMAFHIYTRTHAHTHFFVIVWSNRKQERYI